MFNVNFSNISAISWREQIILLILDTYKTLRNKTYFLRNNSSKSKWEYTTVHCVDYNVASFNNITLYVDCTRISFKYQLWEIKMVTFIR